MTLAELEFIGSEYDNGHAFGSQGRTLVDALATITEELGRALTAGEWQQFEHGWAVGVSDRAAWRADQATKAPETTEAPEADALARDIALAVIWTGIPF